MCIMKLTCVFNLFFLSKFTTPFYFLQLAYADEKLRQGVFDGKEVTVLAYNVTITHKKINLLFKKLYFLGNKVSSDVYLYKNERWYLPIRRIRQRNSGRCTRIF